MKAFALAIVVVLVALPVTALTQEPTQIDPDSLLGRQYKIKINRLLPQALDCYNEALQQNPELAGQMKIRVTIAPDGVVVATEWVEDTMGDRNVAACIAGLFEKKTWPKSSGPVYFDYKFVFAPAEE